MITKDFSPNSLGGEFISYFNFKSPHIFENLLGLCHELKENPITSDKGVNINLNDIILYDRRDIVLAPEDQTPENILIFALGLDSIPEKYKDPIIENSIKISDIYITNDLNIVFSSLINVIYKIRCSFFHGSLLPDEKNNKIIKHCYFILHFLLKDVIWKESQYK